MIAQYLDDTFAAGVAAQNQLFSSMSDILLGAGQGSPEQATAARETVRAVNLSKVPPYQVELTKIQNTFMAMLKEMERNAGPGLDVPKAVTEEIVDKMISELDKGHVIQYRCGGTGDERRRLDISFVSPRKSAREIIANAPFPWLTFWRGKGATLPRIPFLAPSGTKGITHTTFPKVVCQRGNVPLWKPPPYSRPVHAAENMQTALRICTGRTVVLYFFL